MAGNGVARARLPLGVGGDPAVVGTLTGRILLHAFIGFTR